MRELVDGFMSGLQRETTPRALARSSAAGDRYQVAQDLCKNRA